MTGLGMAPDPVPAAPPTVRPDLRRWIRYITPRVVLTLAAVLGLAVAVASVGLVTLRSVRGEAPRVQSPVALLQRLHGLLLVVAGGGFLGALWSARELWRRERDAEIAAAQAAELREQRQLARLGRMAAVVAHEVRNPLAALSMTLSTLHRQLPADAAHARDTVEALRHRIRELDQLVTDILEFARPATPRRQRQSLRTVIEAAWAGVAEDAALRDVGMDLSGDDAVVDVDGMLLRRAFANLLLNAGQAMDGHGRLTVHCAAENGRRRVTITDRGPGIPPDIRAHLFEPFVTTKTRGTGLGLAIARHVVEAHDGTLALADAPGGGTTAVIDLPAC